MNDAASRLRSGEEVDERPHLEFRRQDKAAMLQLCRVQRQAAVACRIALAQQRDRLARLVSELDRQRRMIGEGRQLRANGNRCLKQS